MNKIEIGTRVERIASDYTNGRKGEVIEINGERARVRWTDSPRTWVNFRFLRVIPNAPEALANGPADYLADTGLRWEDATPAERAAYLA